MSSALGEHEYEPIANPAHQGLPATPYGLPVTTAPVVRITDTDVVPVGDSDESIDIQERKYSPKLILDGDVVLPLDGQIEDSVMQGRELGETGDTSEDLETAQQLQDRLEERFLNAATPCTESRTDAEINTSQVDSVALEELPLQRGARGFPQRLRSQAGKLRTRLQGIQRPTFSLPDRRKGEKAKVTKIEKSKPLRIEKAKTVKTEKAKSDKPRFSLPDRPRFSLPDRPKFNLPDRPKFNFPDRPKFSMPERPKFNFPDRAKFNLKRPNINLPTLGRVRRPLKERQSSTESASGSKRNIFDFATYPRLFDKKSKSRGDYATSSPKPTRARTPESATVPRVKKKQPIGARWADRFTDIIYADDDQAVAAERSRPWRHPSIEEPQVAMQMVSNSPPARLPWEESETGSVERSREESPEKLDFRLAQRAKSVEYQDSMEVEEDGKELELPTSRSDHVASLSREEDDSSYQTSNQAAKRAQVTEDMEDEEERGTLQDPRVQDSKPQQDAIVKIIGHKSKPGWRREYSETEDPEEFRARDSYDQDYSGELVPVDEYGRAFMPIDPRKYATGREGTPEEASIHSDREQRSSGSSSDRRRRGVLEEIDSDEFFLRAKGISQDEMNVGRCLATEIRDAFRPQANILADPDPDELPPTRPTRTRSFKKGTFARPPSDGPPARPKRDRRRSEDSRAEMDDADGYFPERTPSITGSGHRIIYQAEEVARAEERPEDVAVVKPVRRKSRSIARSQSEFGSEISVPRLPPTPPVAPRRRKRGRRLEYDDETERAVVCNGLGRTDNLQRHLRDDASPPREEHRSDHLPEEPEEYHREGQLDYEEERSKQLYDEERVHPLLDHLRGEMFANERNRNDRAFSEGRTFLPDIRDIRYQEERDDRNRTDLRTMVDQLDDEYIEPAPIVPKRRSRSRGTSVADDDRTSRGAESLPEGSLAEEEPARETDSRDFPGYAVVQKPEKPPRPPPPRRRKDKFATSPRPTAPVVPVRPRRAYSTLGPARTRSVSETRSENQLDVTPYVEVDSEDEECREFRVEEVVDKIQGRPLPAPPRPPRARRDPSDQPATNGVVEVAASTQTDPLPDDVVIEEEVTRAKLVMAPSRSGSQVLVSTERVASPTFDESASAVPPLPRVERERTTVTPSPTPSEVASRSDAPTALGLPSVSPTDDRVRITSLEVGDLRVERLNVSQLEASKISASEIDAVVVSATEVSNASSYQEGGIHPTLLRELIAIRSQLEQVTGTGSRQGTESHTGILEGTREPLTAVNQLIKSLEKSDNDEAREDGVESKQILTSEAPQPLGTVTSIVEGREEVEKDQKEVVPGTKVERNEDRNAEDSEVPSSFLKLADPDAEHSSGKTEEKESVPEESASKTDEGRTRGEKSSRSRSPSPTVDGKRPVRQTASPVRSLPPVISVTPDTPDPVPCRVTEAEIRPQRAVVSYSSDNEEQRFESTEGGTRYVAFPTSQIPASFFNLASPAESEPSIAETTQQLVRALRTAGTRAMRHFVGYVTSRVNPEERGEKLKEVELALCALMLLVAGLLILFLGSPRVVTHYHHWDYFNPPQ